MANLEIRTAMLEADVRHYEVASALGITQESYSRLLRNEVSEDKKEKILKAISSIKK